MSNQPGKAILYGMLLVCAAFGLPQLIGGSIQLYQSFARYFLVFILLLIFLVLLALYVHEYLVRLDVRLRQSAASRRWLAAGLLLVALIGLALCLSMSTWNDEGFNQEAAHFFWDRGADAYFTHYAEVNRWLGRHHPPVLAMMYALWYGLVDFSLLAGRLLNLAFAIGTAVLTFFYVRRLTDEAVAGLSVLCLVLTPMWCFSSASALLDMPFTFLFVGSLLLFEMYIQEGRARFALLAGALAAVTILSRYNGLFLFPIWFAQLLADKSSRPLLKNPRTALVVLMPALLGLPWIGYSLMQGTLVVQASKISEYLLVALVRPGGWLYLSEILLPLFPIMIGIHTLPLLIWGFASCRRIGTPGVRRLVWGCAIFLILIVVTLPNPRYVLPGVPMLAAITAIGLWRLASARQGMAAVLIAALLCTLCFVAFYTAMTALHLTYIFY